MTLDDIDDDTIAAAVQRDFARAVYTRPIGALGPRRHHTLAWTATAAVAIVATTAVVVLGSPTDSPAFGWSAEARAPTDAELQTSLTLCDAIRQQVGNSTEISPNTSGVSNMSLDALDLRGDFAVATLHTPAFTKICFLSTDTEPWNVDSWLFLDAEGPAQLKVNGVTAMIEGRTVIFGWTSPETASVELRVPDLPAVSVEVHEHMFATWVPITLEPGSGTVESFDASGALIGQAPVELWPTSAPIEP